MKKFILLSDLHTEWRPFEMPDLRDADVSAVLLAGDAGAPGELAQVMIDIREQSGCAVYAVEGNHDLWRRGRQLRTWKKIRAHNEKVMADAPAGPELRILRGGEVAYADGVRIIGATLWTDGRLGQDSPEQIRETLLRRMNDYKKMTIHDEVRGLWRKALPEDLFREHRKDLTGILNALDTPFDGPTIVMTHHVPLKELLTPIIIKDDDIELSGGYGSDLGDLILARRFDAWVYGHSHQPERTVVRTACGAAIFASNPRGYPHETHPFDPQFEIHVGQSPDADLNLG